MKEIKPAEVLKAAEKRQPRVEERCKKAIFKNPRNLILKVHCWPRKDC